MRDQPLYLRVKEKLLDRIRVQKLRPGSKLPTEDEMMAAYGVSRITVRKAVELLQREGLVERFPRRGTFIASGVDDAAWIASSMDDVLRVSAETVPAWMEWKAIHSKPIAQRLQVPGKEALYRLRSLREYRGVPIYFLESFVPGFIGRKLTRSDLQRGVLLFLTEEKLGVKVARGIEEITAGVADRALANKLKVKVGAPLLILEIVYFDFFNRPVQYARTWYRADKFKRSNLLIRGRADRSLSTSTGWQRDRADAAGGDLPDKETVE